MQYELIDKPKEYHRFKFSKVAPDKDGVFFKSNGGTEQQYRYLIENLDPKLLKDYQIICSRVRQADLDPNKKKILWLHDTWDDPESQHLSDPESRARFERLVFVSNYQFLTYHMKLEVPYDNSMVLRNSIEPIETHTKPDPKDGIRLIYHTTPHRGLELLIPAYLELLKVHKNLHLDVYSSFSIYGWAERDEQYKQLFDLCKNHPNITYHGSVPNTEIREALKKAHIFAYPCIWPETSCIAAIEAMSAGCTVVTNDYGALFETLSNHAFLYRWSEHKNKNVNDFASLLNAVIKNYNSDLIKTTSERSVKYVAANFDRKLRLKEWESFLSKIQ